MTPSHPSHSLLPSGMRLWRLRARTSGLEDGFINQVMKRLNPLPALPSLPPSLCLSLTHTVSALPLLSPLSPAHRNLCSTPPTPSVPQTQRPPHTSITPTELPTPLYLSVDSFALWMDKDCESSSSPSIEITLVCLLFFAHIVIIFLHLFAPCVREDCNCMCMYHIFDNKVDFDTDFDTGVSRYR